MQAAVALVVVLTTVTATVVQGCAPRTRQAAYQPRRLTWEEHAEDLRRRGLFRRMYRMDEHTFDKLAELLRPILERNDYFASEKRDREWHRESERVREGGRVRDTLGLG